MRQILHCGSQLLIQVHKDVRVDRVSERAKQVWIVLVVVVLMEVQVDMAYPITLSINLNVLILHQSHIFMKKKRVMRALVELAVLKTRHLVEPAVVLFGSRQLVL